MFSILIPIVAGWTLGLINAKLIDDLPQRPSLQLKAAQSVKPSPIVEPKQTPLTGRTRQAFQDMLQSGPREKSEEEKEADRGMIETGAALSIVAVSQLVFPPLQWTVVPYILYGSREVFKLTWKAIKERRLRAGVINAVLIVGWIAKGYIFTGAFFAFFSTALYKLHVITRDRSQHSIISLFGQQQQDVALLVNGQEVIVPFEQIVAGDLVVVYAGEMIPVDGVVIKGEASVDQHALTGESQPVEKVIGSSVLAATTVISGKLHVRVEKAGEDSVAAQITDVLNQTAGYHTTIESSAVEAADRAIGIRLLLGVAAVPIAGGSGALAVWLSNFGLRMRVLGPLSMLNFLNLAAHANMLIKDGRSLELIPKIDAVVFDKTGTLTLEQPHVLRVVAINGYTEQEVLSAAASAEYKQSHPIAHAIVEHAQSQQAALVEPDGTHYEVGLGIRTQIKGIPILVGSLRFMQAEQIAIPAEIQAVQATASEQGNSLVYVALHQELAGVLVLRSTVRPEVSQIIATLHQRHMTTYIISGDQEAPTRTLANELGVDHYYAETLPADKARIIDELQAAGHSVCFIGDGINDGIALRKAHVSISLRGATTIATDAAQIVLMDQTLNQFIPLLDLADAFDKNMKANYALCMWPSVLTVGGVFLGLIGFPGAIALNLSTGFVALGNTIMPALTYRSELTDVDTDVSH